MESREVERRIRRILEEDPHGVVAAYLFGSVARETSNAASDVDVGVLYSEPPPATFEALPFRLQEVLETELCLPVDVVVLNQASPDLCHRILRDGRLVLDRNPSTRIRFEVRARNQFFDMEPFLRRYRQGPSGASR